MPDTFEKLLDVARKYPEFGILSPIQMASDGQTFEKMFKLIVVSKLPQLQDSSISNISDVLSVEMVQAAHWLVSIDCVRIIGGFSPSFPHYGEDSNYCHRALYFIYMIGVVPSGYDSSIYVDANALIFGNIAQLTNLLSNSISFVVSKHSQRNTVFE